VCGGDTGHAEAVEVEFDPKIVSYQQLLEVFWDLHDPTAATDEGGQDRSAVFIHSPEQRATALAARDRLSRSGELKGKIATEIVPAGTFWRAEEYHQQYVEKGGWAACHRRKGKALTL
jgi:peptide-methionine (S)-S-oxide reductase